MGGGDLNLKKSWHPQTLRNQEKVWKAEQIKVKEEMRLQDLRREINDERNLEELKRLGEASGVLVKTDNDKKLEWMYKSSADLINREEYLLGKTIDKTFEVLQAEEERKDKHIPGVKQSVNHVEHDCVPFSIRDFKNIHSKEQVDLQRKVLEDPLMLIKQREMESRRRLLENPVKLKELHELLKKDEANTKAKKLKKDKHKKAKKSKKKKLKISKRNKKKSLNSSSDSDSDSSDSDIDTELARKYKKLKGTLGDAGADISNLNLTKLLESKYRTLSKELDKAVEKKTKCKESQNDRDSSERDRNERKSRQNMANKICEGSRRLYYSNSRQDRSLTYKNENDKKNKGNGRRQSRSRSCSRDHQTTTRNKKSASRSPSAKRRTHGSSNIRENTSRKLSEKEKARKRDEMIKNAAWREADRYQAVKKHREAYAREEDDNKNRDFDRGFINKEVKKSIDNHTSIGSRIRSNLNNIQRTSAAMDSNFARK